MSMEKKEKIINHIENLKVPEGRSKSEIWTELQKKMEADTVKSKKFLIKQPVFYYSVASIVIVFFSLLFILSYNNTSEIFVHAGQKEIVFLPDGSEVVINSVSKLLYSKKEWKDERVVELEGEAFFKVKKGSDFTVRCINGSVKVTGTIFNVFSRRNTLEVKCTEGAVSVHSKSGKTIFLKENQLVNFRPDNNSGEVLNLNNSNTDLWTNGQFYFQNKSLDNVFDELERQFNMKIQFDSKSERVFNGYFNNKDLDQALKMICKPMGLEYQIENNSLVLITTH